MNKILSDNLAAAEALILKEIGSPEVRAVLARLLDAVETKVESQTSNPFLRSLEVSAFGLVKGYLAPTPAA